MLFITLLTSSMSKNTSKLFTNTSNKSMNKSNQSTSTPMNTSSTPFPHVRRTILSRPKQFTSKHGINHTLNDYLSITKDQQQEGLCWAFSLTSAFEMSYARDTGNRLMLEPKQLHRNAVPWWNKQSKELKKQYSYCLSYMDGDGYVPECVLEYLVRSHDTLLQEDGEDSFLMINYYQQLKINSLRDMYDGLDYFGVLYATIDAEQLQNGYAIYDEYYPIDHNSHAVVITGIGTFYNTSGVYLELLNSWGYNVGYDGLQYIKVAESELSFIVNNMNILSDIYGVHLVRDVIKQYADTILALILILLLAITFCALIVFIILCIIYKKKAQQQTVNNALDDESDINSNDELEDISPPPTITQSQSGNRNLDAVLIT